MRGLINGLRLGWAWPLGPFSRRNDLTAISVPMPKSLSYSRDIMHAHPYLIERWPKVLTLFREMTGCDLVLTCSYRSPAEQLKLYEQGRTVPGEIVTFKDGQTAETMSQHNFYPSRAIDVAVDKDPAISKVSVTWNEDAYTPLGEIAHKLGLVWGGTWARPHDCPHLQIPQNIT